MNFLFIGGIDEGGGGGGGEIIDKTLQRGKLETLGQIS